MANDYYNAPTTVKPLADIESADENQDRLNIEAGFDKLPTEAELQLSVRGVNTVAFPNLFQITVTGIDNPYTNYTQISFVAIGGNVDAMGVEINGGVREPIVSDQNNALGGGEIVTGQEVLIIRQPNGFWKMQLPQSDGSNLTGVVADLQLLTDNGVAATGRRNIFINGRMNIWQREVSVTDPTSTNDYASADRWRGHRASDTTGMKIDRSTNVPASSEASFSLKASRVNGNTATASITVQQQIEGIDIIHHQGREVTISGQIYLGANLSATNDVFLNVNSGTVEDQVVGLGATFTGNQSLVLEAPGQGTDQVWTAFAFTFTIPDDAKALAAAFSMTPVGTAGVEDAFYITDIQLELGAVATDYDVRTLEDELKLCKRFYEKSYNTDVFPGAVTTAGVIESRRAPAASAQVISDLWWVPKRTTPLVKVYSPTTGAVAKARNSSTSADVSAGSGIAGTNGTYVTATVASVAEDYIIAHWTADAEL